MKEHKARRRFGQNFLVDEQIVHHILDAIAVTPTDRIVEIGPGLGALTQGLAERAGQLTLVELDRDLAARLQQRYAAQLHIKLLSADALQVDYTQLAAEPGAAAKGTNPSGQLRMVGNLPYNISTPLMFHFFKHAPVISDMTFMLQREVAQRLLAAPGDSAYSRLSVMAQFHCRGDWLLDVPPQAFNPAPKVHSAVVRLIPITPPLPTTEAQRRFADIVRSAFNQRRKTLRNSLRQLIPTQSMEDAGIDPSRRPETLSVDDFVTLTQISLTAST